MLVDRQRRSKKETNWSAHQAAYCSKQMKRDVSLKKLYTWSYLDCTIQKLFEWILEQTDMFLLWLIYCQAKHGGNKNLGCHTELSHENENSENKSPPLPCFYHIYLFLTAFCITLATDTLQSFVAMATAALVQSRVFKGPVCRQRL